MISGKTARSLVHLDAIFDDFPAFVPYIGNNTVANVVFQMVKRLWLIQHRPMILHSPTENSSLVVLNHKILRPTHRSKTCEIRAVTSNVSFNKSIEWQRAVCTCCAVLLEPQLLDIMIVQFRE
ncbi:hypothetical protein TNCV_3951651 [Trichonephila clavipes]|nr:hypothetical protein TNCV_3951651 [Trichonephila clavipes]